MQLAESTVIKIFFTVLVTRWTMGLLQNYATLSFS